MSKDIIFKNLIMCVTDLNSYIINLYSNADLCRLLECDGNYNYWMIDVENINDLRAQGLYLCDLGYDKEKDEYTFENIKKVYPQNSKKFIDVETV